MDDSGHVGASHTLAQWYPKSLRTNPSYRGVIDDFKRTLDGAEDRIFTDDSSHDTSPIAQPDRAGLKDQTHGATRESRADSPSSKSKFEKLDVTSKGRECTQLHLHFRQDPKCRFIFLSANEPRSSFKLGEESIARLLAFHQIMPTWLDFVTIFEAPTRGIVEAIPSFLGKKKKEKDPLEAWLGFDRFAAASPIPSVHLGRAFNESGWSRRSKMIQSDLSIESDGHGFMRRESPQGVPGRQFLAKSWPAKLWKRYITDSEKYVHPCDKRKPSSIELSLTNRLMSTTSTLIRCLLPIMVSAAMPTAGASPIAVPTENPHDGMSVCDSTFNILDYIVIVAAAIGGVTALYLGPKAKSCAFWLMTFVAILWAPIVTDSTGAVSPGFRWAAFLFWTSTATSYTILVWTQASSRTLLTFHCLLAWAPIQLVAVWWQSFSSAWFWNSFPQCYTSAMILQVLPSLRDELWSPMMTQVRSWLG